MSMWINVRKPKKRIARQLDVYMIEGQSVTIKDIAKRMGRSEKYARAKFKACTAPVTWSKLCN